MTDREKALAYDKAIERARAYYNSTCFRNTLEALENIFPEIKEEMNKKIKACIEMCLTDANEQRFKDYNTTLKDCLEWLENQEHISKTYLTVQDDKSEEISKEIIKYLEQTVPHHHRDELLKSKEWIAWLKNQNPQKLDNMIKPIFNVGDTVRHKNIEGFECTIESIDDSTYYGNTTNFDIKDQNNWKLVEPIDYIAYSKDTVWNESDRLHLGSILSILKTERNNAEVEQYRDSVNSDIDWINNLKNRVISLQPNTDYCKEDYCNLNEIMSYIKDNDLKVWLKNHIQPQPKQWWSEDDEYNLQCMIAKAVSDIQNGNVGRNNELIDWLNSLKNRISSPLHINYSKEDLERINRISDFIMKNRKGDTDEIYQQEQDVKWLKSLKYLNKCSRVFDEIDKEILRAAVLFIQNNTDEFACNGISKEDVIGWLDSLKNSETWQPTEMQLHAFEQVYDWYNNNFAPSETLTSLYNDLKMLYEK